MKLNGLNTKIGAAQGAFLHLTHPALGHRMFAGEHADPVTGALRGPAEEAIKVGCHVLGTESEAVRQQAREIQKRIKENKSDENTADENALKFAASLVTEFHGLEDSDGNPLEATEENKINFFRQSDGLVEQVVEFANDRGNFFGGGTKA